MFVTKYICALFVLILNNNFGELNALSIKTDVLNSNQLLSNIEQKLKRLENFLLPQTYQNVGTSQNRDPLVYQILQRVDSLGEKLIKTEELFSAKFNRIGDLLSNRNFKEDLSQTEILNKLEMSYNALFQKIVYLERKQDEQFFKIQELSQNILSKIETMDFSCKKENKKMDNDTNKMILPENIISDTVSVNGNNISEFLRKNMDIERNNQNLILNLDQKLEKQFNDYANKVADMNSEVVEFHETIIGYLSKIENTTIHSKMDLQNDFKTFQDRISKKMLRDNFNLEINNFKQLNQKLDGNFDKIISSQNSFLESCHRLQMNESQIETKISDVLEKLIDSFEGKSSSFKNLEKILRNHDFNMEKTEMLLSQISKNVVAVYEKESKDTFKLEATIKGVSKKLENLIEIPHKTENSNCSQELLSELTKINQLLKDLKDGTSNEDISNYTAATDSN